MNTTIDTPEFRVMMNVYRTGSSLNADRRFAELVAHIDMHCANTVRKSDHVSTADSAHPTEQPDTSATISTQHGDLDSWGDGRNSWDIKLRGREQQQIAEIGDDLYKMKMRADIYEGSCHSYKERIADLESQLAARPPKKQISQSPENSWPTQAIDALSWFISMAEESGVDQKEIMHCWGLIRPHLLRAMQEPSVSKDNEGNFTTGDSELDLLLGLTEDMVSGNANMDTGLWWSSTLSQVKARLTRSAPSAIVQAALEAAEVLSSQNWRGDIVDRINDAILEMGDNCKQRQDCVVGSPVNSQINDD